MIASSTPFHFDAGRTCLDFVATENEYAGTDGLGEVGALTLWIDAAGLALPLTPITDDDLNRAHGLRSSFARVLNHSIDTASGGWSPTEGLRSAITVINYFAAVGPPDVRLVGGPSGRDLEVCTHSPVEVGALFGALARDFLALLGDSRCRARLRRCEAADCRQVYMQPRLGRARRWCSGQRCGARSRVAAYRTRVARKGTARSRSLESVSA